MKTRNTRAIVASVVSGMVGFVLGAAVVLLLRSPDPEPPLPLATTADPALASRIADMEERLRKAEAHAEQAESDAGTLLQAVDAASAEQEKRAAFERARMGYERVYQQDLARRRAEEAKARARIATEVGQLGPAEKFLRLLEIAAAYADEAKFQEGLRVFGQAIRERPPEIEVTDDVRSLEQRLGSGSNMVEISIRSDGGTVVMIPGQGLLGAGDHRVRLPSGNYEVVGMREGYQDVRMPLRIRPGLPAPEVFVACTVPGN